MISKSPSTFLLLVLVNALQKGVSLPMGEEEEPSSSHDLRCMLSETVCNLSCYLGGQTSAACVRNVNGGKSCVCLNEELVSSVCKIGDSNIGGYTCAGYCQILGKQSGDCKDEVCTCVEEDFDLTENYRCASNEICSLYCQIIETAATGTCTGPNNWDCECERGGSDPAALNDEIEKFSNATSSD